MDQGQASTATMLARDIGFSDAHIVSGGLAQAVQQLDLRSSSPEYVIIDIASYGHELLPALDEFALHCEPNVRVLVIGQTMDEALKQAFKARGVIECFVKPVISPIIRSALIGHNSLPLATDLQQNERGTVISCMSAASGDGASTLALNLAYCLATEFKQPTVLVDMDYQFGLICKSLDIAAPFGIRELFDHPERGLDELLVSKMLVNYKDKLSIIAAPAELRLLPVIRPDVVRTLIAILRRKFRFVVLDVPHVWTDWTAASLTYSDHTVMVAQLWLRSLTHATRLLTAWQAVAIKREAISLVINRSGAKFKEAVTTKDFESICRRTIDAYINNDVKAVTYAENNAQTIFEGEQNTLLRQQISELARMLVKRYDAAILEDKSAKKTLLSFLLLKKGTD